METRRCYVCRESKAVAEFYKNRAHSSGYQTKCKACQRAHSATGYAAKKDREYYERNREARIAAATERKRASRERYNAAARANFAKTGNSPKRLESLRAYQARKRKALPPWANRAEILRFYEAARAAGGEVDHIVPLRSPLVCGLHCEFNLQVLPRSENRAKSNAIWPDMP